MALSGPGPLTPFLPHPLRLSPRDLPRQQPYTRGFCWPRRPSFFLCRKSRARKGVGRPAAGLGGVVAPLSQ